MHFHCWAGWALSGSPLGGVCMAPVVLALSHIHTSAGLGKGHGSQDLGHGKRTGFLQHPFPHKLTPFALYSFSPFLDPMSLIFSRGLPQVMTKAVWACDMLIIWIDSGEKPWLYNICCFLWCKYTHKVDFKVLTGCHCKWCWEMSVTGSDCAGSSILFPWTLIFYDCTVLILFLSIPRKHTCNSYHSKIKW